MIRVNGKNIHTVIIIEHHLDVIKTTDYVIDLGPEGGEARGYVVAQGRPEDVAGVPESFAGRYLRAYLDGNQGMLNGG